MGVITPTRFSVDGVPVDFIDGAPIEITISRGVMPSTFGVIVARDGTADKALRVKRNPVTLKIECADHTTVGKDEIELQEWYIVSRREREQGMVQYVIADVRWAKSYNKLTAEYNIVSYGGAYRYRSLNKNAPWKAVLAAEDALKKLGYTVAELGDVRFSVGTIPLPDNLGNDEQGGGWVSAPQEDAIPPMLEGASCDPVPTSDGKLAIVDRFTENSKNLQQYAMAVGDVAATDATWQEPAEIIVPFRKRIERMLHYQEVGSRQTTSSSDSEVDVGVDNVMPDWRPMEDKPVATVKTIADWMNDTDLYGIKYLGGSLAKFRQVYLKRVTFNPEGSLTPQQIAALFNAESLVRKCFWLWFRIRPYTNTKTDDVRGKYADIKLERLQKDGTGKPGAVYMDYTRKLNIGRYKTAARNPLNAVFSENVSMRRSWLAQAGVRPAPVDPAPASARWIDREGLVFEISFEKPDSIQVGGYLPGHLVTPVGISQNDFQNAKNGTAPFVTDDSVALKDSFEMAVFWHGLWTGDGAGEMSRTYNHKVAGAPSAKGRPTLTTGCVMDVTANYAYDSENGGKFPGVLLNQKELAARAQDIAREIKDSLKQKRAGISTHVGIGVLTRGKVWVAGDIHEIKIIINGRKPGSVETRVTVLPGKRPVVTGPITGRRGEAAMESARIL